MAFDFPSSPTTGQTYSVTGGPTYVYNGTAWQVLTPGNQFNRTVFTATAGQTTFTMNYVVGAIDVYRNGVKLAPADFAATSGTSIVLANGCTVGDTVEVISYPMITYTDAVKRTGDTMTGTLTVNTTSAAIVTTDGTSTSRLLNSGGVGVVGTQSNHPFIIQTNDAERLRVDTSGRVTTPYQPFVNASRAGSAAWLTGTFGIAFNIANVNNGNHYNTSNGIFTAPVAGYYRVATGALCGQNLGYATLYTYRNGASYGGFAHANPNGYNLWFVISLQNIIYCAAGDTIQVVMASTNQAFYDGAYNYLSIELVG